MIYLMRLNKGIIRNMVKKKKKKLLVFFRGRWVLIPVLLLHCFIADVCVPIFYMLHFIMLWFCMAGTLARSDLVKEILSSMRIPVKIKVK